MPPGKKRHHKCPTVKNVVIEDIKGWRLVTFTIVVAVWWRATNGLIDIIFSLADKLKREKG